MSGQYDSQTAFSTLGVEQQKRAGEEAALFHSHIHPPAGTKENRGEEFDTFSLGSRWR